PGSVLSLDAGGGTRTPTLFRAPGPKPGLSTQIPARPRLITAWPLRSRCHTGPRKILDLALMEVTTVRPGYELWRPNREKAQSKTTKAIVTLVLLVTAGLMLVITIGGWPRLEGP